MTEVEKLIQEVHSEPATLGDVALLLDKCCADLGRLMETRQIARCIHTKNLVFGLGHARDSLREVCKIVDEICNQKQTTKMPTQTEAKSSKAETPFGAPVWPWNQPPLCGEPTRERCQSVVSHEEAEAGLQLVAAYRAQESIALINDIDGRAVAFEKPHGPRGVGAELLRREMAACDHEVYLKAQAELAKLREEALALVTPIVKRLAKSLSDELNDVALTAEERLDKAGLPVRYDGNIDTRTGQRTIMWMLHTDPLITALWSCRGKAEAALASLSVENSIGCAQFFCSNEEHTPWICA